MKKAISFIISLVLLIGSVSIMSGCQSVGTTYYISASEGNDSNSGTSQSSAWKSFANVKDMVLGEGDKVLLKRGDEWNERLTVRGTGTEAHNIVIGCYGDAKMPKPAISLNNERDDICIVVTDASATSEARLVPMKWITLENITVKNANVGIYFRALLLDDGEGITIRNIEAYDILCDSELKRMDNGVCTVDDFVAMKSEPKGDLETFEKSGKIKATGGGAGEYMYSIAILVRGVLAKGFTNVKIYDNVMYNCITGIELYYVNETEIHDNICTGTYAGVFRLSIVNGADVYNNRAVGGSEKYTFFGGTCAGYAAVCTDIDVHNNEFAYEYNLDANDGTGFDYEAYCENATLTDNVFHHNDAGGILVMANEGKQHKNVLLEGNLFYNDIRNPRNNGYVYEILFINNGKDNMTFRRQYLYMPEKSKNMKTKYYGCAGVSGYGGTIIEDNSITATNDDYRSRFSFNKDGNGEGFAALDGTFTVSGGSGLLKAEGKKASIMLSIPQNGFACNNILISVNNEAKGTLYCSYETTDGVKKTASRKINGKGNYSLSMADEIICDVIKNFTVNFTPDSNGGEISFDFLEFYADFKLSAEKKNDNTVLLTFGGKINPMLALEPSKDDISLDGYTVTAVKRIGYNQLEVTVSEKINDVANLKATVKGGLFIEYYADLINGLDVGRTASQDASVLGCKTQQYYMSGSLTLTAK